MRSVSRAVREALHARHRVGRRASVQVEVPPARSLAGEGGSVVTITENGEIGNPVMRFLSRFVFGQTSTMEAYLRALGRKFGETVTPGPGVPAS